jgi:hypothetical protein
LVDIEGAKALKRRLGPSEVDEASLPADVADIPADAPPVYHWTGKTPSEARSTEVDEHTTPDGVALFRRLGLSPR